MKNTLTKSHAQKLFIVACIVILAMVAVACRMTPPGGRDTTRPALLPGLDAFEFTGSAEEFFIVFSEPVRQVNSSTTAAGIDIELEEGSNSEGLTRQAKTVSSVNAIVDGRISSDGTELSTTFLLRVSPALADGRYVFRLGDNIFQDASNNQNRVEPREFAFDANQILLIAASASNDRMVLFAEFTDALVAGSAGLGGVTVTRLDGMPSGITVTTEIGTLMGADGGDIFTGTGSMRMQTRMFSTTTNNTNTMMDTATFNQDDSNAVRFTLSAPLATGVDYRITIPANTFAPDASNNNVTGLDAEIARNITVPASN